MRKYNQNDVIYTPKKLDIERKLTLSRDGENAKRKKKQAKKHCLTQFNAIFALKRRFPLNTVPSHVS